LFLDFSNSTPPIPCGYDESNGEDKQCCLTSSTEPSEEIPVPVPAFTDPDSKTYKCVDHTDLCQKWYKNHPESCFPGHSSYKFMRLACMNTCGRCGDKVY
jgi:hypothetical protein